MRQITVFLLLLVTISHVSAADTSVPVGLENDNESAIIGDIVLVKSNIFDLSDPEENKALYRLANKLHIVTKDKVIRKQLLFSSGAKYSARLIAESGRILRQNRYLYDAEIKPVRVRDGVIDITVATKDVWSLGPDISISRSGGENRTKIGLEETNFFGLGQTLRIRHEKNVDRTSDSVEFYDRHLGRSWVATYLSIANNSDGKSNQFSAIRPFHALDARWTAGVRFLDDDRRSALYFEGDEAAEYQHVRRYNSAFGGWSAGLNNGYAKRWTAGITHDENRFSAVTNPSLPSVIPEDRNLIYPFIGFEVVEDDFESIRNHDQIGKTEDFYLGTRLSARLGWSDKSLGADRDAIIFRGTATRGFGALQKNALILSATASGRVELGHAENSILRLDARYYRTQSAKRLFFAAISVVAGHNLDVDNVVAIGGDTGLRGYPLRYQNGDSKLRITLEQRYFTDWYPMRFVRIGGAVFIDAGRVWGPNPLGEEHRGWLADVGFGLRMAPTRGSSGKMVHLDLAFPLNSDDTIDDVQILLAAKRSF